MIKIGEPEILFRHDQDSDITAIATTGLASSTRVAHDPSQWTEPKPRNTSPSITETDAAYRGSATVRRNMSSSARKKVLLMGKSGSGKTSMRSVILYMRVSCRTTQADEIQLKLLS